MGMMSIVDQDNFLFDMSIRDNIMLGKPDADDKALAASVDAAGCREIVERLEGGLHTVVGTGGALLSTGERQRICIARAILRMHQSYCWMNQRRAWIWKTNTRYRRRFNS